VSTVLAVKANPKKPDQAYVTLHDQDKDAWCPSFELASKLVIGEALPPGWDVSQGDYGPRLFPPKEKKGGFGGGAAAWRNTKEGAFAEQERMDRRTALMQAVTFHHGTSAEVAGIADEFYAWLRKTAGGTATPAAGTGATAAGQAKPSTAPPVSAPTSAPVMPEKQPASRGIGATPEGGAEAQGPGLLPTGAASSPGPCAHPDTSPLKMDGKAMPKGFVRCLSCNQGVKAA
jgi:hypothetical protein